MRIIILCMLIGYYGTAIPTWLLYKYGRKAILLHNVVGLSVIAVAIFVVYFLMEDLYGNG